MDDASQIGSPKHEEKRLPNPGMLGLELAIVNTHINELHHDEKLSRQEHDLYLQFYFFQREKIKQQLKVLTHQERVELCERDVGAKQKAVDFANSEGGRADARKRWQIRLQGAALSGGSVGPYQASLVPETAEECEQRHIRASEDERDAARAALASAQSDYELTRASLERYSGGDKTWEQHQPAINKWEREESWEAITPEELQPAAKSLRTKFDHHAWKSRRSTEVLGYEALHPQGPSILNPKDILSYQKYLIGILGGIGRQLLSGEKLGPSAIFKQYLDAYHAGVKIVISVLFQEFLEIATPQSDRLGVHPIEWAKKHLQILIWAEKTTVKQWIKRVCDHQEPFYGGDDDQDESIYWGRWRAPKLIHMQPAGNTRYELDAAWARENLEDSQRLLEGRGENFTTFLVLALSNIVDEAYIRFAKNAVFVQPKSVPPPTQSEKQEKRPGPPSRLPSEFVELAGELWLNALQQSRSTKVSDAKLREIASNLDATPFSRPGNYLEGKFAKELREFNSRNSKSSGGAIKTWSQLVTLHDKDHIRGFRKLLSRCAETLDKK